MKVLSRMVGEMGVGNLLIEGTIIRDTRVTRVFWMFKAEPCH